MGSLTIRNLDDRVIETLKAQAKENQRSLESEIRYLLTQRIERHVQLASFRDRTLRIVSATLHVPQTDSVDLLREDRDK